MSADGDSVVQPIPGLLLTRMDEDAGVLLDPSRKLYFALNGTGLFLWECLVAEGSVRVDALVASLVGEFDTDRERAAADVRVWVSALREQGLVVVGPGA